MGNDISSFPRRGAERDWNQEIHKASFRGVVFEVDTATVQFGRRGTIHQFPFKDIPFAEDVGRQARVINITAFVDGDNYINRRNDLIKKIEDIDTPGTLILPTMGAIRVKPTADCNVTFNQRRGGIEAFTLKFVEAGKQEFPKATLNTKETSKNRADDLADGGKDEAAENMNFEQKLPDSSEGINDPDSLADESVGIVDAFNQSIDRAINTGVQVGDAIDEFSRKFTNYKNDVRTLILDPASLLDETDSIYSDLRKVYADTDLSGAFEAFRDIFNSAVDDIAKIININDPSREQQDKNNQTLRDINRNLLIVQLSNITVDEIYVSTNQVRQRRSDILELFEQQIENAGNNHDRCQRDRLVDLRSSIVADLNQKIGGLPDEVEFIPGDTIPAAALANTLYGDGLRGEEIATTNNIINPNLLPAQKPLNVLSA